MTSKPLPMTPEPAPNRAVYHVPRSQVYPGSRGGQRGKVHLHLGKPFFSARLARNTGHSVCGRIGWYERPAEPGEERCQRCVDMAERYGILWP